jgi:hypothetical protein
LTVSHPDFAYIEKKVRKKVFGVISTIDSKDRPHSTGIVFAIPPPEYPFAIYMVTGKKAVKARNIRRIPATAFVVTFPHYYIRFAPTFYAMFRGTSEILPIDDEVFRLAFSKKMVTRKALKEDLIELGDNCVIKLIPEPTVFCFGLGINPLKLIRNPGVANYKVTIPVERLS